MGADLMSRQFQHAFTDIEDYRLSATAFSSLQSLYGVFSIDMFANSDNAKCSRFVSRHADVGSLPGSIDVFSQPSWGTSFYAFPPVDDAYRALEHILAQHNARGVPVLPLWVRLNSYHRLFPDGNHFIPQVTGWHLLSLTDLEKGFGHASFLSPNKGGHKTPFIAILLNTTTNPLPEAVTPIYRFCLRGYYGRPSECLSCSGSNLINSS